MTLDEFIENWHGWPNNAWVDQPGFHNLYVRRGKIGVIINDVFCWCDPCLTIATVNAETPGSGAFTELIQKLRQRHMAIYVENAHELRFQRKLLSLGFTQVNREAGPNFLINHQGRLFRETS